jgi:hypothetical protein
LAVDVDELLDDREFLGLQTDVRGQKPGKFAAA